MTALTTSVHEIKTLVRSFHSLLAIRTVEEDRVTRLLTHVSVDMQLPLFEWTITRGVRRVPGESAIYETTDPLAALRHVTGVNVDAIWHFKDFGAHLELAAVRRSLRELAAAFEGKRSLVVLTGDPLELPREVAHHALEIELAMPSRDELVEVVRSVVRTFERQRNIVMNLNAAEASSLIRALSGLTLNQARQAVAKVIIDDGVLDARDIPALLSRKAAIVRADGLLEFYPPDGNHAELGGLENLKEWLDRARTGFSERAKERNLRPPRGVLIVGVQGCGKSLAAKFIARRWGLPLLKLDAGRLYDKYVGESERNFRRATQMAEAMAPAVLWIDEIEKAFAQGNGDADGGLSRRIFGSFLTWLQEKRSDVFVVGAANDLMSLPPELLRKGRFDEIFFVDLPNETERRSIIDIHLRLRRLDPASFDVESLTQASDGYSGAEIEQAMIGALYGSLHRNEELTTEGVLRELRAMVPLSVSRREDVDALRVLARERFAPATKDPAESG